MGGGGLNSVTYSTLHLLYTYVCLFSVIKRQTRIRLSFHGNRANRAEIRHFVSVFVHLSVYGSCFL